MHTVAAAEFKARCLKILDDVRDSGAGVVITKHGHPVAKLVPVGASENRPTFIGACKGQISYAPDHCPASMHATRTQQMRSSTRRRARRRALRRSGSVCRLHRFRATAVRAPCRLWWHRTSLPSTDSTRLLARRASGHEIDTPTSSLELSATVTSSASNTTDTAAACWAAAGGAVWGTGAADHSPPRPVHDPNAARPTGGLGAL